MLYIALYICFIHWHRLCSKIDWQR